MSFRRGLRTTGEMYYPPSYLCYQRGAECDGKGEPGCHPSRFSKAAASPANQAAKTSLFQSIYTEVNEWEKNL